MIRPFVSCQPNGGVSSVTQLRDDPIAVFEPLADLEWVVVFAFVARKSIFLLYRLTLRGCGGGVCAVPELCRTQLAPLDSERKRWHIEYALEADID